MLRTCSKSFCWELTSKHKFLGIRQSVTGDMSNWLQLDFFVHFLLSISLEAGSSSEPKCFCITALPCLSWNASQGENRGPPQILDASKGPTHRSSEIPVTKPLQHLHCSKGPWALPPLTCTPASKSCSVPCEGLGISTKADVGKLSAKVAEPSNGDADARAARKGKDHSNLT